MATALERLSRAEDVVHVAAMPDVHLANDVCIGTAIATSRTIYPAAVGGDIGCGMAAVGLSGSAQVFRDADAGPKTLRALHNAVPIVQHLSRVDLPEELECRALSDPALERKRARTAREQLGTLGRGNHFLEVQADEEDGLWLMVHSGSRGMGQAIRDHHLKAAERRRGGLLGLDAETEAGRNYLSDLSWALDYAAENRRRIVVAAGEVLAELGLEADDASFVSCHHNHVRHEQIADEKLWVHRKGAISAHDGEAGLIPGSMGTESFHVRGRGCRAALNSCSHGAGRSMSRSAAQHRISVDTLRGEMTGIWFDQRLASRLRDEAPSAYKDIGKVMRAQRELTRIVRRLRPLLVFKGG
ncbi:MAG: RtcB family protein [Deltaproteobacteria bacterium]|nr:RtcB family protein [Deltaproteobacteria bacterium]